MKNPTDRRILKKIHDRYYSEFCNYLVDKESVRSSKIQVPIDCRLIAKDLNVDKDIIFGRLYYHLNYKHGYTREDGSRIDLFNIKVGEDQHTVNFPFLSALLAEHRLDFFRFNMSIVLSLSALIISILGVLIGKNS